MITTFFSIDQSPVRCTLKDPRDPHTLPEPPAVTIPAELWPGGGPSAERARYWQRRARAAELERLYNRGDIKGFDLWFAQHHADDPLVQTELHGRALGHALRLLNDMIVAARLGGR